MTEGAPKKTYPDKILSQEEVDNLLKGFEGDEEGDAEKTPGEIITPKEQRERLGELVNLVEIAEKSDENAEEKVSDGGEPEKKAWRGPIKEEGTADMAFNSQTGFHEKEEEKTEGGSERGKSLEKYVAKRNEELNEKAEKFGPGMGKFIRSAGEKYNKLNWKYKLGIGIGLGVGAAAFSGVSAAAAGAFATGIGIQRVLGGLGMFTKIEKHLQETGEGKRKGFFAAQEWYKKIAAKSETQRTIAAAIMAVGYTAGMSYGIKEAVHLASESSYGEAVHEWLKNHYPFGHTAVEAPSHVGMPLASVDATSGHGYEFMMKQLWKQLHDPAGHYSLPPNTDPNSDIARLFAADHASIDKVVHQIAADPQHGFFHDGASVRIDPGAHMNIGADGKVHLDNMVHASTHAPVTGTHHHPMHHHAEAHTAAHPEPPVNPAPESPPSVSQTPSVGQQPVIHTGVEVPHPPVETVYAPQPEVPVVPVEVITNPFGLAISIHEPHFYLDGAHHIFVHGGPSVERVNAIQQYLAAHPKDIVYDADANGAHRIPWHFVNGKAEADMMPVRTRGFLGFGRRFMKAPEPNEFRKLIK